MIQVLDLSFNYLTATNSQLTLSDKNREEKKILLDIPHIWASFMHYLLISFSFRLEALTCYTATMHMERTMKIFKDAATGCLNSKCGD